MVRYKKRYFVLRWEIPADWEPPGKKQKDPASLPIRGDVIHNVVKDMIEEIHGDFGRASVSTGMRTVYCNSKTRLCLIQCRFGPHRILGSSLPFITKIKGERVVPRLIYTGATIKNCYKRMLKFQQEELRLHTKELDAKNPDSVEI